MTDHAFDGKVLRVLEVENSARAVAVRVFADHEIPADSEIPDIAEKMSAKYELPEKASERAREVTD